MEATMKKHVVVWTVIVVTASVFPLWAQGTAGNSDTLSRLLAEVHALRVAMERSASTGPQVQLLTARLTVQNERLTRATKELDAVHVELANVQRDAASFAADAAAIEEALSREADPTKVQVLKQQARGTKMHFEDSTAKEAQLHAREMDFANALAAEQIQWAELNRRFDELERQIAVRTPQ